MRFFWTLGLIFFTLQMVRGQACEALFTFESTGITIHFIDISTHGANDPIVSWNWNFDDGGSSSQQNPTHTFPEPDRYDVVLQITTQNGCSSQLEIRIEICDFGVITNFGSCNAQGQIPVSINISDLYDNAKEIDVTLDGQNVPGSPFDIDAENPVILNIMVPGNGLQHTISIQSTDIETCGRTVTFTTEDCSSDCFLSSLQVGYVPGTTHNVVVDDNFFSPQSVAIVLGDIVHFTWAGGGHSTTSDVNSGDDAWNSGVIGQGSTFDVNIHNPGTHGYYCIPHGGPNGSGMSGQILSNCPSGSNTNLVVQFNTSVANAQGFNVLWDNTPVPGSPFNYSGTGPQSVNISIAGDGMAHSLIVRDVADPACDVDLMYNAPDCDQGGGNPVCSISGTVGNYGGCNNNQVTASLTVNVMNGGSGFLVSIDNGPNMPFSYNGNSTTVTITLPGDGGSHNVKVTDNADPACTTTITAVTPDCSVPCSISNLTAVAASGNGSPSGIIHTVSVQDFQFNPNVINMTVGDVVQWNWTGQIPHTSTSDATGGADSWDSGLLNNGATYTSPVLSEGTHPYYCEPHGAPGGVGMAGTIYVLPPCDAENQTTVQVSFDILSNGTQGFQVLVDGAAAGTYPYVPGNAQSASVPVIGDGASHTILVRDVANNACSASTTVVTSDCNGGGNPVCAVTVSAAVAGPCAGANVPVALTVSGTYNGPSYSVTVDGNNAGTYNYSNPNVTINIAGNGGSHTIVVTDTGDPACTASTTITTPDCSLPCAINNLQATVASGSGGPSGVMHTVLVEDFQFNPNVINITVGDVVKWNWTGAIAHTTTSDIPGGANGWDSGLLGNGATFTSPVLEEGVHPYYCVPHGAPGGIGMAGTIHVLPACNEFGQTPVQITFSSTNGGASGYAVLVDGNVAGTFPYVAGPAQSASVLIAGNGMSHAIIVRDVDDNACQASVSVVTPDCGGGGNPVCSISLNPAVSGGCVNNMVAVNLNVSAVNNSTSYAVTLDGQNAGTFQYSNSNAQINVPGNGLPHTIIVTDSGDADCTATSVITTPDCSLPCAIQIVDLSFGNNVTHTVNVEDFQFAPQEITINLGDTIDFVWTGVIPHTVTSDSPNGPNAFNSGLLSQGAHWELIPGATGDFPYYCIPHGAPGGVGMAGVIHVTSACDGSNANGALQITYSGTSGQGVVVTQDGTPINGSPFPFNQSGQQTITVSVNGDGASHVFAVSDAGNASCAATQTVTVPNCGQACSVSITQATVSSCMGNTVSLSVVVASNQPERSFNVYKDGIKLNPLPLTTDVNGDATYTTLIVGNNTTSTITVQFAENASCTASASIQVPACAGPCLISNFMIGQTATTHVIEVRDFEFFPAQKEILLGDTVRFLWTGVVPHTTTSDQLSGPNSWNSGLLGEGAVFDLVLEETGNFPYYCAPHGGPGGLGMSGAITVSDTCDMDRWKTNLTFDVSAGSPLGYNVFVDGVKITDPPLQYDDPVGHNEEIISLPGDGAWHLVTVQDMETGFCAYTTPVLTGVCGAGCTVVDLTAQTGSGIIHEIEVRDYDYLPAHLTIRAGEKIRFVWTGQIPHTVTSDAVSGPDVFNSGLLGFGSTFDLIINTPGVHPYFCIPHGGPGGIGMAGTITVLPACTDNQESVQLSFGVTNGSIQGYNLFVDGMLYGNNPRHYDDRMGENEVFISYPSDNATHIITIQDLNNPICAASDFFTTGACMSSGCALSGLDYAPSAGVRHDIEVRDFDYLPKNITIELGDTLHFIWTGQIPHTVTSDVSTGPDVFNSGLWGQGYTYDVVLTTTGTHGYYCIPHGAPGGVGMAGTVEVVDPCDDGQVNVDFLFFASGPGASYDVLNQGNVVLDNQPYQSGGIQYFTLNLPATGQSHLITVSDNGPDSCETSVAIDSFDCSDPCFFVRASYQYDIQYSTLTVQFTDKSRGNIVSWHWDFGDGQSSNLQHPSHVYAEATLYEVCLTITDANGCVETVCDKIRLGADVCQSSFTYEQDGLDLIFYNTSDVSSPGMTSTWTFGDGQTSMVSDSVPHQFALGLYEVCLTVAADGCLSTSCQILDLTDPCLALKAKYSASIVGGNPLAYQFTDMSSGPVGSRLWGFGDGQISSAQHPSHTYAAQGIYNVCLLILDQDGNCTNSDCRLLYVGTTSVENEMMSLKKIMVAPNPVGSSYQQVRLSGFEQQDLHATGMCRILDAQGRIVMKEKVILTEDLNIPVPIMSGPYYIQVVSGRNTYGAMIVVQ